MNFKAAFYDNGERARTPSDAIYGNISHPARVRIDLTNTRETLSSMCDVDAIRPSATRPRTNMFVPHVPDKCLTVVLSFNCLSAEFSTICFIYANY